MMGTRTCVRSMSTSEMRKIMQLEGGDLFYKEEGDRDDPVIVLLHGFPGDAVKIHRALVIGMGREAGAFEIVKALAESEEAAAAGFTYIPTGRPPVKPQP